MSQNWNTYKLNDLTTFISRGVTPAYTESGGVIVLNQKCIRDGKVDFSASRRTDPNKKNISSEKYLSDYDILINSTGQGTLGRVAQLKELQEEVTADSHVTIVRPDSALIDSIFLGYVLKSKQSLIESFAEGSTGQTELSREKVKQIDVNIPPIEEQRRIAKILFALDEKIELNLQMNATLEKIAQATFKQWFVDFQYPGFDGELVDGLPSGWKQAPIDAIAEFLNGLAMQKFPPENEVDYLPVIKIRELRQGITDSSDKASVNIPEQYIVNDGDVLFSWSGSLEVIIWSDGKGGLNQHLFKVTSKKYPKWFYYFWTKYYLPRFQAIAQDKATTMGHIQRRHLTESIVNVPTDEILNIANQLLNPLLEKLIEVKLQNQTLIQIRDGLLPKLMSGKIRVGE
jgi:type I restriction enzyme S subunit